MREENKVNLDWDTLESPWIQDYEQFERTILDLMEPSYGEGGLSALEYALLVYRRVRISDTKPWTERIGAQVHINYGNYTVEVRNTHSARNLGKPHYYPLEALDAVFED